MNRIKVFKIVNVLVKKRNIRKNLINTNNNKILLFIYVDSCVFSVAHTQPATDSLTHATGMAGWRQESYNLLYNLKQ